MLSPLYPWVLWYLRKARNRLVFENFTVKEHKVVPSALLEARRLQAAQSLKMQKPSPPARAHIYYDSTISGMECFLDASWQVSTHYGGRGWVFKNPPNGWSLTNSSNRSHVASALLLDARSRSQSCTFWSSSKELQNAENLLRLEDPHGMHQLPKQMCGNSECP